MNTRNAVRYNTDLLPDILNTVSISWDSHSSIETNVINYCAHGIRVLINLLNAPFGIPKLNNNIKVQMPIDQKCLTGMCVYAIKDQDGTATIGIYFFNPTEQYYLQNILYKTLNTHYHPCSFITHEWEELVDKLCNSDDIHLRKIGYSEKCIMPDKDKGY